MSVKAYYNAEVRNFLDDDDDRILARISEGASQSWCSPTGERPVRVRP